MREFSALHDIDILDIDEEEELLPTPRRRWFDPSFFPRIKAHQDPKALLVINEYHQSLQLDHHRLLAADNTPQKKSKPPRTSLKAQRIAKLAEELRQSGDADLALAQFQQACEASSKNAYYRYRLAQLLVGNGQLTSAIQQMIACVKAKPDDGYYHFYLGTCLERAGLFTSCSLEMHQAVLFEPLNDYFHMRLAVCHMKLNNYEQASGHLRQALRIQPTSQAYHYLLGDTYCRIGLTEEAHEHYQQASKLCGFDADLVRWAREYIDSETE
ncbi:MAG: tetratricopeptide repeat protein [Armatimonadota bacterium]